VSPRAVPRRVRVPWLAPRESEARAGAIGRICVVGKPSTISNSSTSRSILIVAELSSCFGVFHRLGSLPGPRRQDVQVGRLLCAGQSRSGELGLLNSNCRAAAARSIHKAFSCKDFSRGVRSTSLTRRRSGRKMCPRSGTSKRSPLRKSPNGPVGGLSPEICGERGLTECAARSTASNLRAKGWSVSRPQSGTHGFQLRCMKP